MEIQWLGHSCFRLRSRRTTILTDPYQRSCGYSLGRPSAQVVTVSHHHPHHSHVEGVAGSPKVVEGPGEYEIEEVLILGIGTYHDAVGGKQYGKNTVYLIELEELRVCHLGDLGHVPTTEQIEELAGVDVLFVPTGGHCTIGAAAAAETVSLLEPRLVIPMHYKTEATTVELDPLERFLKEMGIKGLAAQPRLTVTRGTLPQETQVTLLEYPH